MWQMLLGTCNGNYGICAIYFSPFVRIHLLHKVSSLDIVLEFQVSTVMFWLAWNYSRNFLYVQSISSPSLLTLSCLYIILHRDFPLLWIPGDWSIKTDRTVSIDSSSNSRVEVWYIINIRTCDTYRWLIFHLLYWKFWLWLLQEHWSSTYSGHSYHMVHIKHY